jgi:hypothetical protein
MKLKYIYIYYIFRFCTSTSSKRPGIQQGKKFGRILDESLARPTRTRIKIEHDRRMKIFKENSSLLSCLMKLIEHCNAQLQTHTTHARRQ